MRDFINIGSVPIDEDCAQVGRDDYYEQSKRECNAFKHQLYRVFPEMHETATGQFIVKSFPHDFGTYREVVAVYDDEDAEAMDVAFRAESETPEYWDFEAKRELELHETRESTEA